MRRAFAIIPLFVAALLAQIYAPVGSSLAMGRAQALGLAPLCVTQGAPDGETPRAPDPCCDLCAFVMSGAAPLPPAATPVVFHRPQPRRIAWTLPAGRIAVVARRKNAQARAPPSAS